MVKKPKDLLEHVIVYGMVHLIEGTYSLRFMAILEGVLPDIAKSPCSTQRVATVGKS
jgi:predicted metal-dependent hydrolase